MIPVKNIYHMLSYAFSVLQENGYQKIATEEFENVSDLCAAILIKGISLQLKKGLQKEYRDKTEPLTVPKGKLNISASVKTMSLLNQQLVCTYDDFTVNSYRNRIIKSTAELLIKSDIARTRKKVLRKLMIYFADVETIDLRSVNWKIAYNRRGRNYILLISICYFIIKGLLQTTDHGKTRLMDFLDEQRMCRLYEKFILEYYRKEFPQISASASQIKWQLDDENCDMLPIMQSDIMLTGRKGEEVFIIDAKYYSHTTQTQYGKSTVHSANLYQIFTYVKNKEKEMSRQPHKVSGMILYAWNGEEIDEKYSMSGNEIFVKTLNLNCEFEGIKKQLNAIVQPLLP